MSVSDSTQQCLRHLHYTRSTLWNGIAVEAEAALIWFAEAKPGSAKVATYQSTLPSPRAELLPSEIDSWPPLPAAAEAKEDVNGAGIVTFATYSRRANEE